MQVIGLNRLHRKNNAGFDLGRHCVQMQQPLIMVQIITISTFYDHKLISETGTIMHWLPAYQGVLRSIACIVLIMQYTFVNIFVEGTYYNMLTDHGLRGEHTYNVLYMWDVYRNLHSVHSVQLNSV